MASRVVLSHGLRQLVTRPSAFTVPPKYSGNVSLLLSKTEKTRFSFTHIFSKSTDAAVAETDGEVNPDAPPVVDIKEAAKMRTRTIPVEVSMKYLKSNGISNHV